MELAFVRCSIEDDSVQALLLHRPARAYPGAVRHATPGSLLRDSDHPSHFGSFFFTATFFSAAYAGIPSFPYGGGAAPRSNGAREVRALSVMP